VLQRLLPFLFIFSFSYGKTIVEYRGSSNPSGGSATSQHFYEVTKNAKTSYYRFSVGTFNATITNLATQKSHDFAMFNEGGDAIPYRKKSYFEPSPYYAAFLLLTNKHMSKGDKILSTKNSKGVRVYCLVDKSHCKTHQEVVLFLND